MVVTDRCADRSVVSCAADRVRGVLGARLALGLSALGIVFAWGGEEPAGSSCDAAVYATEVVRFDAGSGAGFGHESMPGIVLGPPRGGNPSAGTLDVISLGAGGEIVLGFGDMTIVDGPGPDFVVFENTFWVSGDPANPFAELGEVSVSDDGESWWSFGCTQIPDSAGRYPGCAGWRPQLDYDLCTSDLSQVETGGDLFDLADVGLARARYVRITDLAAGGAGPTAGFDLDAVGLIAWE